MDFLEELEDTLASRPFIRGQKESFQDLDSVFQHLNTGWPRLAFRLTAQRAPQSRQQVVGLRFQFIRATRFDVPERLGTSVIVVPSTV